MATKPLTKSLHTVTAVTRVALHLIELNPLVTTSKKALDRALQVLGYDARQFAANDPTVAACLASIKKASGLK